jgi:hypothetical protein
MMLMCGVVGMGGRVISTGGVLMLWMSMLVMT